MTNTIENLSTTKSLLTASFKDPQSAASAYQALLDSGYESNDIHILMSDESRKKYLPNTEAGDTPLGNKALEGMGVGSAIGGTAGAIAAALLAVGTSLIVPGLGLVIAGPLAASLAGAGAGGFTGGVIGLLIGSGIPSDRAAIYESAIKSGSTVIGVSPKSDDDSKALENKWKEYKAENIFSSR